MASREDRTRNVQADGWLEERRTEDWTVGRKTEDGKVGVVTGVKGNVSVRVCECVRARGRGGMRERREAEMEGRDPESSAK